MRPLHWSNLRWMGESPAHCRYWMDHDYPETTAMRFGSLVDAIVYEQDEKRYAAYTGRRGTNAYKDFVEEHTGKEIVTTAEYDRAKACAEAVVNSPFGCWLRGDHNQTRLDWTIGGRKCAGTPDTFATGTWVADLKVTPVTHPKRLVHHARRMGWDAQLSWYANGIQSSRGRRPLDLLIVTIPPKPPFVATAYKLTEAAQQRAHERWLSLFHRFIACEESNEWPGYAQEPIPFDVDDDDLVLVMDGEEVSL